MGLTAFRLSRNPIALQSGSLVLGFFDRQNPVLSDWAFILKFAARGTLFALHRESGLVSIHIATEKRPNHFCLFRLSLAQIAKVGPLHQSGRYMMMHIE